MHRKEKKLTSNAIHYIDIQIYGLKQTEFRFYKYCCLQGEKKEKKVNMEYKKGNPEKILLSQGINIIKWRARKSGNLEFLDLIWQQKGQQKNQSIREPKKQVRVLGVCNVPRETAYGFSWAQHTSSCDSNKHRKIVRFKKSKLGFLKSST